MFKVVSLLYLLLIFGIPAALSGLPCILVKDAWLIILLIAISPFIYSIFFVLTAGLLSIRHHKAIRPGVFPIDPNDPIYYSRKLYGLCWTSVYYFKPIYFLCLNIPILKLLLFRIFGYKGDMEFTVYPDTWIRDLPILNFGKGSYLSNRATIGTNIVLSNGHILVDEVSVGEKSLVGHLSMLAPGVNLGNSVEISVGCSIGIKTIIEDSSHIGPVCGLEHGISIGKGVKVGPASHLGSRVLIKDGVSLPLGSLIPRRASISNNSDALLFFSSKTKLQQLS